MTCKIVVDPYNVEAKCCEITPEPVRDDGPLVDGVLEVENHEQVPVSGSVVPRLSVFGEDAGTVESERTDFNLDAGEEANFGFEFEMKAALGNELWEKIRAADEGQAIVDITAELSDLSAEEDELPNQ